MYGKKAWSIINKMMVKRDLMMSNMYGVDGQGDEQVSKGEKTGEDGEVSVDVERRPFLQAVEIIKSNWVKGGYASYLSSFFFRYLSPGHREYEVKTTLNTRPDETERSLFLECHLVLKRYSDFEALYQGLVTNYLECLVPPLPDKSVRNFLVGEDSSFVNERIKDLEYFVVRVNAHPVLRAKPEFKDFLTYDRGDGHSTAAFTFLEGSEKYKQVSSKA